MNRAPRAAHLVATLLGFWLAASPFTVLAQSDAPAVDLVKPSTPEEAAQRRRLMLGKWLGDAPTKDGGVRRWLAQRFENGTYRITFQLLPRAGEIREQVEVGHWGVVGPVYFSIFRGHIVDSRLEPSDPSDPGIYDAYEILELTPRSMTYRSYSTGNQFTVRKVPDDYELGKAEGA